MNECPRCGMVGGQNVTHVCMTSGIVGARAPRSSMTVTLPADVWTRIVFAAKDSEDYGLRTLIEQAVYEARPEVGS